MAKTPTYYEESRIGTATVGHTILTTGGVVGNRKHYTGHGWGKFCVLNSFTGSLRGYYRLGLTHYSGSGKGYYAFLESYSGSGKGHYRMASSEHDTYRLYRGVDEMPDFEGDPWVTFDAFPYMTPALDASHTYYFTLRQVNEYGLESLNYWDEDDDSSWKVEVDSNGDRVTGRPDNPYDVELNQAASAGVQVKAVYNYLADDNEADTWLVYSTTNGVDPDPDNDSPTEVTMSKIAGVSYLDTTLAAQGDGNTCKVIVRTRISGSPDVDSDSTTVNSLVVDGTTPSAPEGDLFGDDDYSLKQ